MIANNSPLLYLWSANSLKVEVIETSLRDNITFLTWGKNGPLLCLGTAKGGVLLYNQRAGKKVTILGKHTKRITSGAWSCDNLLALGAEDRTLSISTVDGDTVHTSSLRAEPSMVQFSEMKTDDRTNAESTVIQQQQNQTKLSIHITIKHNLKIHFIHKECKI